MIIIGASMFTRSKWSRCWKPSPGLAAEGFGGSLDTGGQPGAELEVEAAVEAHRVVLFADSEVALSALVQVVAVAVVGLPDPGR